MNRNAHLVIGMITVLVVVLLTHWLLGWFNMDIKTIISLICITYIFSLLPDIDHKMSTATWLFLGIGIVGIVISLLNTQYHFSSYLNRLMIPSIAILVLTFLAAKYAGHRKFIHTVWFGAILSSLIYLIIPEWRFCVIAMIAYQSHLMADGYMFKIK